MRGKLAAILLVVVALAAACVVEQISVKRFTQHALEQTALIFADIRSGELVRAKEKAHAMDQAWDQQVRFLEMMVDHRSTDEVCYALSKLIAALESEAAALAMICAGELEGSLEHVLDRQALTLENLL